MEETKTLNSVAKLSPNEFQKWLKWGRRGYEHCAHTLERLFDFKYAVYDEYLDMFFKSHRARLEYIRETKLAFPKRKEKLNKAIEAYR